MPEEESGSTPARSKVGRLIDRYGLAELDRELVDHVSDDAEAPVVALLPEDAAALDDDYERLREI